MNEKEMLRIGGAVLDIADKLKWKKADAEGEDIFETGVDKKSGWSVTVGHEVNDSKDAFVGVATNIKTGETTRLAPKHAKELYNIAKDSVNPQKKYEVWLRVVVGVRIKPFRASSMEEAAEKAAKLQLDLLTRHVNGPIFDHTQWDEGTPPEAILVNEVGSDDDQEFVINEKGKASRKLYPAFVETWTESERGWGTRPDGYTIHLSREAAVKFIEDYNKKHNTAASAPEVYTRADGNLTEIRVGKKTYQQLLDAMKKGEFGIWGDGNHPKKELP